MKPVSQSKMQVSVKISRAANVITASENKETPTEAESRLARCIKPMHISALKVKDGLNVADGCFYGAPGEDGILLLEG